MTETPYHRPGTFSKTQEAVVDIAMIIVIISAWPFLFGFFYPAQHRQDRLAVNCRPGLRAQPINSRRFVAMGRLHEVEK